MAKKRKKKHKISNKRLSPENYIIKNGKQLDFYECYLNDDWQTTGLANVSIIKKMPSGKFILGLFLVDNYCLGLKNTLFKFNIDISECEELISSIYRTQSGYQKCETVFAHNLIYGAIDYAGDLGFYPQKDFKITEYLLDSDLINDGISEIEFGKDGNPLFVQGPNDNVKKIINQLNKSVGEENYHFIENEV